MSLLKDLKTERAKTYSDATALLATTQTNETRSRVTKMLADVENLGVQIGQIERADALSGVLTGVGGTVAVGDAKQSTDEYRSAWHDYMTNGTKQSERGFRTAKQQSISTLNRICEQIKSADVEQRDQVAGTQSISYSDGAAGGFFVPAGFVRDVEKATKYFAPLMDGSVLRIMETATGNVLPYPTSNDTTQAWTIVGETSQVTETSSHKNFSNPILEPGSGVNGPGDVGLGHVTFGAFKGSTGMIRVSLELLQDSAFNIETFLIEAFAQRLGRGYEWYLTRGNGVNMPSGILTEIAASGAVPVTAAGSSVNDGVNANNGTNSIGYADLVNLIHSVDPSYRSRAKFMMHDDTVRQMKTLLDKYGRPLWVPSVREGEPDTLCGYRYVVNQQMDRVAASATTVAFGDFSKFIVRKVKDLSVLRLDERFADFGECAFIGFSRLDSKLVDAGSHPVNALVMHS